MYILGAQKTRLIETVLLSTHKWDGSFEHPQHMFWMRNKKVDSIYALLSGDLFKNYIVLLYFCFGIL